MIKIKYSLFLLLAFALASCSNDDDLKDLKISDRGTVTDDAGNEYGWVRIGNLRWTTSNARNGADASETTYWNGFWNTDAFSEEQKANFRENVYPVYGNYMDFDEAVASAPDGWRVPTDEDWQTLEKALGLSNTDTYGFRGDGIGYAMQQSGSGCELGLLNGGGMTWQAVYGWRELNLDEVGEYGYYWTSTSADKVVETERAYYRKICAVYGKVDRDRTGKECKFSVRWVSDAN